MAIKFLTYFLATFSVTFLFACSAKQDDESAFLSANSAKQDNEKSIVIIYENDVHSATEGYAKFAGLRDNISDTAFVLAVSSGDFLQGGAIASFSKGEYIIDIMNSVGYDVVTIGNHEFDYMPSRLFEMFTKLDAPTTNVNLTKTTSSEPVFNPYIIKNVGTKKIAFIGILTPETILLESYAFTDSTGNIIYSLHENEIYKLVQSAVDSARTKGADYVILLSHLGELPPLNSDITSIKLIQETSGINAVLDGHTHSVIAEQWVTNTKGDSVLLSQTGSKFSNIGKLQISKDGEFHSELIPTDDIEVKSAKVTATLDSIKKLTDKMLEQHIATSSFDLKADKNGERYVRQGETNLGDLNADAFRFAMDSQIGLVNGGNIRANIPAGEITYKQILEVSPFNNDLCKIEATGAQIIEALEQGTSKLPAEFGGFLQVSGLRYSIDQSKTPKVSNVMVENKDGSYSNINSNQTYTVAMSSYIAYKGNEITAFKKSKILKDKVMSDSDALVKFFQSFGDSVPERYIKEQGRIIFTTPKAVLSTQ